MTGDSTKPTQVGSIMGHIEAYILGDDFNDYIERMDLLIALNSVAETNQMCFCIGFCGPDLYKIIKSRIAPKSVTEITYEQMKTALKTYFDPKLNVIAERFKFHSRQQKAEEPVGDYIVELKALSRTCDYGAHLTEALRDQLVFGVGQQKIQAALLREKDLTFEKACTIAKSIELTNHHVDLMQQDNTVSVFTKHRLGPRVSQSRGNQSFVERGKKKLRYANYQCYSCGLFGHTSRSCRAETAKTNEKPTNKPNKYFRKNKINELEAGASS